MTENLSRTTPSGGGLKSPRPSFITGLARLRTTLPRSPGRHLIGPVLVAGMLGGVLGGAGSYAAGRLTKPAAPAPTAKDLAKDEAHEVAEHFLELLKGAKYEAFLTQVKTAYTYLSEEDFQAFKKGFENDRLRAEKWFGASRNEFELLQQEAKSADLVESVFLEKFDHGAFIWRFVLYRGKDRWRIAYLTWTFVAREAFAP